jgi:hypothetical protein
LPDALLRVNVSDISAVLFTSNGPPNILVPVTFKVPTVALLVTFTLFNVDASAANTANVVLPVTFNVLFNVVVPVTPRVPPNVVAPVPTVKVFALVISTLVNVESL